MSSVIPFPSSYVPPVSDADPEFEEWVWWWSHVRERIPQETLTELGLFPCRAGGKPAFLCDLDLSDRENLFVIRCTLAACIPEHASDVVFLRSDRSTASAAIDIGLAALYADVA